jgi:hypothetical protein
MKHQIWLQVAIMAAFIVLLIMALLHDAQQYGLI